MCLKPASCGHPAPSSSSQHVSSTCVYSGSYRAPPATNTIITTTTTATTTTATVNSSTHATSHAALSFRIDLHTRHVFRFCWFDLNGFALVSEGGEIQVKHEYTQS